MAELSNRPSRAPDFAVECFALIALAEQLAASPTRILQKLAETALTLCGAQTAGISLLQADGKRFYWPAIAGQWAEHLGGGTPREYGPCGTVLDNNTALMFSHPERDFDYLVPITPCVEEALLMPFYVDGKAVGTVWVIAHDQSKRFESEDLRLMRDLCTFASSAYQVLVSLNAVVSNALRRGTVYKPARELRPTICLFIFQIVAGFKVAGNRFTFCGNQTGAVAE